MKAAKTYIDIKFQFTPPRRGRHDQEYRIVRTYMFQFTPPRRGRRGADTDSIITEGVSIHAPAKGATRHRVFCKPLV